MLPPYDPAVLDANAVRDHAARLGFELPHPQQIEFLTRSNSLDVQAAPGSGKTTLAGLKLCILASGWCSQNRGLCVLSHTNTAKQQLVSILETDPHGRRVLDYPHFIGTIQSFVDAYLALPHLRSAGIDLVAIDNDRYGESALEAFRSNRFSTLRNGLDRSRPATGEQIIATATYGWSGRELDVFAEEGGRLPFGPDTASGKQYRALKDRMLEQGYLRYHDAYALGLKHAHQAPWVLAALRRRFPFVLIDEMQDTNAVQEALLQTLFGDEGVVQRIGDENQRIFTGTSTDDEESLTFPRQDAIDLDHTMRFGRAIADVASELTVRRTQTIQPADVPGSASVALIVFDEQTAPGVLPAFRDLVTKLVDEEHLGEYPVKALGARKAPGTNKSFPQAITSYAPGSRLERRTRARAASLIEATTLAKAAQARTGNTFEAGSVLWAACSDLLSVCGFTIDDSRPSPRTIKRWLADRDPAHALRLRRAILELLNHPLNSEASWAASVEELGVSIAEAFGVGALIGGAAHFVAFDENHLEAERPRHHRNRRGTTERGFTVQVDTIQYTKGETHAATLILECQDSRGRIHDLGEVIPILAGTADPKRRAMKSVKPSCQLVFVGATRPRHLLAFAAMADHVSGCIDALTEAGWLVVDLRNTPAGDDA